MMYYCALGNMCRSHKARSDSMMRTSSPENAHSLRADWKHCIWSKNRLDQQTRRICFEICACSFNPRESLYLILTSHREFSLHFPSAVLRYIIVISVPLSLSVSSISSSIKETLSADLESLDVMLACSVKRVLSGSWLIQLMEKFDALAHSPPLLVWAQGRSLSFLWGF